MHSEPNQYQFSTGSVLNHVFSTDSVPIRNRFRTYSFPKSTACVWRCLTQPVERASALEQWVQLLVMGSGSGVNIGSNMQFITCILLVASMAQSVERSLIVIRSRVRLAVMHSVLFLGSEYMNSGSDRFRLGTDWVQIGTDRFRSVQIGTDRFRSVQIGTEWAIQNHSVPPSHS